MFLTRLRILFLIIGTLCFRASGFPMTGSSINGYNQPCKSGFALRHSSSNSPECYTVKPPEKSSEKYNGCIGNTITIDFYKTFFVKSYDKFEQQDQLNELEYHIFWTDYERVYENGPFVNWRIGDENMGTVENFTSTIFEEWTTSTMSSEPGDCATVDIRNKELKPAMCDQKFTRLCVLPSLQGGNGILRESSSDLLEVHIKYARTENDLIIFNITQPIQILDEVWCFHESLTMTERKRMEIKAMNNTQEFGVAAKQNGNYWCLCINKRDYYSIDSEKIVFVKNKQLYTNTSVMMIKDVELLRYLLNVHDQNSDDLKRKLCPNGKCPKDPDTIITLANSEILANVKISEKLDFDDKILLHVTEGAQILLNYFEKTDVIFTRKLLFCEYIHFAPETEIGHDVITRADLCREYKCEGDYIFGGVWKISNIKYCEQNFANLTSEEQLNFLIQSLDDLLKNTIVNTASLENVARMISNLIEKDDNITIPTRIFQNVETLARRVKLSTNNSQVKIVLPNMAIVVVDNDNSDTPVIGIRVESAADGFPISSVDLLTTESTSDDFEKISVLVNASSMLRAHPNSRLSFVVYQNDKVFKPAKQIVSVRLGDVSYFGENEHIDIKMTLNNNSNGNVCGHGEFNLTANGLYWKTKGCLHIKELDIGGLAFCRCNMLSHFAFLSRDDLPAEIPAAQPGENTSEEQLNFLIQSLDDLLKNTIVNTASLENVARMISNLIEKDDNITIPTRIFQNVETLASRVKLSTNNSQVKIVLPNMAIVVVDNDNSDTPVIGIRVESAADGFPISSVDLLTTESTSDDFEKNSVLVNASSMLRAHPNSRLSFVVYQNDKVFKPTKQIVSVRLGDVSYFGKNEHIDIKMRLNNNSNGNVCAHGEFNMTTNGLYWKTKGCLHLKELDEGGLAFCRCNMLSHFAFLSRDDLPAEDPAAQLGENNPAEQIQYVMQTMNAMMDHPVSTTSLENAATMVDSILKLGKNDTIPSEVLKNLEIIVNKVILPKNQSQIITIQKPDVNIAIAIADNSEQKSIVGIKITSDPDESLGSSFEFLTSDSPMDYSEQGIILVNMSSILSNLPVGSAQLSFIVYQNDKAFLNTKQQVGENLKKVNGKIISVQMGNISKLGTNEYVDIHFKTNVSKIGNENENKECVFWDFGLGPTGHWSTEGCKFLGEFDLKGWETCRCYHLTHFAQLITIHGAHNQDKHDHKLSDFHYRMLTHISFYGCILSIVGLFIVVLTGSLFKTWRNVLVHKLWMNLVASVGIMIFNFLFVSARDLNDQNSDTNTCLVSGIILHYSVLSTFSWMFVIAFFYYQMTANMLKSMAYSDKSVLFLALAFGWLFPLIPMIPLLGFDSDSYSNSLRNYFCYPSGYGFWLAVVLPIFIFIMFNSVFLICILYSIYDTSRGVHAASTRENNFARDIKRFTFLFYQFGLIWIFGLFSKYLFMAYLFCITVSLQGLILSYIFVFGDRKTIKLWRSKFNFSSGEETSYVKSEISSPSNKIVKKNKSDGNVVVPWRKCENSGKTVNTSRIPVCNEKMCSCDECSEEAYLKLLR